MCIIDVAGYLHDVAGYLHSWHAHPVTLMTYKMNSVVATLWLCMTKTYLVACGSLARLYRWWKDDMVSSERLQTRMDKRFSWIDPVGSTVSRACFWGMPRQMKRERWPAICTGCKWGPKMFSNVLQHREHMPIVCAIALSSNNLY